MFTPPRHKVKIARRDKSKAIRFTTHTGKHTKLKLDEQLCTIHIVSTTSNHTRTN